MENEWSDSYLIGISEVDEQHKEFFAASQKLCDEILNSRGEKAVMEAWDFLKDYANKHFKSEEAFMVKHNYPRLDEHKKLHDTFIEQLDMINDEFEIYTVGSQDMADRVGEITTTWLLEHIIDEDTKIAKHVTRG